MCEQSLTVGNAVEYSSRLLTFCLLRVRYIVHLRNHVPVPGLAGIRAVIISQRYILPCGTSTDINVLLQRQGHPTEEDEKGPQELGNGRQEAPDITEEA